MRLNVYRTYQLQKVLPKKIKTNPKKPRKGPSTRCYPNTTNSFKSILSLVKLPKTFGLKTLYFNGALVGDLTCTKILSKKEYLGN